MKWYIGCSGFHYKEWKGVFYPEKMPQKNWFEHYNKVFNTLELNVTFYRFPQLSFLYNWYGKSSESFRFSVKVPRLITHYKKFSGTESLLADFYSTIEEGLKEKLGSVLFQLPPQSVFSQGLMEKIVESVDTSFNNVIEFRHNSWWRPDVYELLERHNISFCGISYPKLPESVIMNTEIIYYRFHGVPKLYYSQYEGEFLQKIADEIQDNNNKAKEVYIYFNNTASLAAIRNAEWLQKYVQNVPAEN